MTLEVRLLGPPVVRRDQRSIHLRGPKTLALLAYLLASGSACQRGKLVDLLYDESADPRASLRWTLSHLRKAIGTNYILSDRQAIQFNFEQEYWLDTEALTAGQPGAYRGEFLEGVYVREARRFMDWALFERERWRRQYQAFVTDELETAQERGDYQRAVELGRRLLELDNLREDWHRVVMAAYARQGQREAALAQFELCRRTLEEELGVKPEPATTTLHEAILAGELEKPDKVGMLAIDPAPRPAYLERGARRREPEQSVFVGREAELARLSGFLERAMKGQGQMAFITGEAGTGKTMLAQAFARRAMQEHPDLLLALGRGNAHSGAGDPYLPFRSLLAMLTGDVERDWEAGQVTTDQARRLWRALPEAGQALVDHGPGLVNHLVAGRPLLRRAAAAAPAGPGWLLELQRLADRDEAGPAEDEQGQFFEQVAAFLHALSRERPLLLILDDLHWADRASLSLLSHLGQNLGGSRLLLLGALRPEEIAGGDAGLHPARQVIDELIRLFGEMLVELDAATAARGRAFVDALLDSEPNALGEGFRSQLHRRTGGQALFTVETLRAMQERDELFQDATGRWRESDRLNWDRLPARVEAVIDGRIGRLDEGLREALAIASVEGESFTAQVVTQVLGARLGRMVRKLSGVLGRQHRLVAEEGVRSVGEGRLLRYRFRHALFQQHMYERLGELERRVLHREVGETLERLYEGQEEKIASQLGRHFAAAGEGERAVKYLLMAGDAARQVFAYREAIEAYEGALGFLKAGEDHERAARTSMKLGLMYHNIYSFEKAQEAYEQGFAVWRKAAASYASASATQTMAPHPFRSLARVDRPPKLDPARIYLAYDERYVQKLFSGLVQLTAENELVPDVALRWEVLDQGRTYIFHLRDDVRWSDGQPVTAGDFEYAWKRVLHPENDQGNPEMLFDIRGAEAYKRGRLANSDEVSVRAVNDYRLEVKLESSCGYFLQVLATAVAMPVPRHVVERFGRAWSEPENIVTNGPFKLKSLKPGHATRLERYEDYHGRFRGNLSQAESVFALGEAALALYERDELDVLAPYDHLSLQEARRAIQRHPDDYISGPAPATMCLVFNVRRPPFDDPLLRRALVLAMDRESLANRQLQGLYFPAGGGLVPAGLPGHVPGIALPYDPVLARETLARAGYPGGQGLAAIKGSGVLRDHWKLAIEFLSGGWKANLGLLLSLEYDVPGDLFDQFGKNLPDMWLDGYWADYPDPDEFLRCSPLLRQSGWKNEGYEALVNGARRIGDQAKRLSMYRQAEQILVEEAPIVPLIYARSHYLVKPWLPGLPASQVNEVILKDVIIEAH